MIDVATILFSTIMCIIVAFRAIRLDGQMPWFGKPKAPFAAERQPEDALDAP